MQNRYVYRSAYNIVPIKDIIVSNQNNAPIRAIQIDNQTPFWYYVKSINAYVAPFIIGWIYSYPIDTLSEDVSQIAPTGYASPAIVPLNPPPSVLTITVTDTPSDFAYGASYGTEVGPGIGSANQPIPEVNIPNGAVVSGEVGINDLSNIPMGDFMPVAVMDPSNLSNKLIGQKAMADSLPVVIASDQSNLPDNLKQVGGSNIALGQTTMSASLPVAIASDQPSLPVAPGAGLSATATESTVAGSASSVALLASNTSRKGATIVNESTAILYVRLSASAASVTAYTVQMAGSGSLVGPAYYEVPYGYTGAIQGIWASAAGNARITEFT